MYCTTCGSEIDNNAVICPKCGVPVMRKIVTVSSDDAIARSLIPVGRTGLSIVAGYVGLFSFIPFVGFLSLVLGVLALKGLRKNPEKHGHGRAWFAIIAGIISSLLYGIAFFN